MRRVLTAVLFVYGAYGLSHPDWWTLLDGVDLGIHETGHMVFLPFGEFIHAAGGTLFQIIMPAAFVAYFWRRGDRHAASVALWWIAQNCGGIARYAADAQAQELPLVGGDEHDWAFMLGRIGLLGKDQQVAHGIRAIGWMLLFISTAWGLVAAQRSAAPDEDDAAAPSPV